MASIPFEPMHTGTGLFDIYDELGNPQLQRTPGALPTGGCNYVDLNLGANGARCGCRRFWTRQMPGPGGLATQDQSGWCMCNHHACYHDHGSGEGVETGARAGSIGFGPDSEQENERPRIVRPPLSPVVMGDAMFPPKEHQRFGNLSQATFFPNGTAEFGPPSPSLAFQTQRTDQWQHGAPSTLGRPSAWPPINTRRSDSLPDTLQWARMSQTDPNALPPIPSQCLLPSQSGPPSVASSTQPGYLRPFAGKGLGTLGSGKGQHRSSIDIGGATSATQMPPPPRTTSTRASPDGIPDTQPGLLDPVVPDTHRPKSEPASAAATEERFKHLSETMKGHDQRLERLEATSFSAHHEDCVERGDQVDLRVTDLEGRMDEVEKLVNDNASVMSRQTEDASQSSSTNRAVHSQELHSQVLALQAQVTQLQSSLPSFAHPWEVEVVFLPFPLQKLWLPFQDFQHDPITNKDDWTQMPMTCSTATMRSQSPFHNDWASEDHQHVHEWLLPKACGETGVVDRRLRSRGLIQTISVKGPDARSVNAAMSSVFGQTLREMDLVSPGSEDTRAARFLGLQSFWVPLRKVHKDSRLRFLTPAEMLTPALWDIPFLTSVMMRASKPRLFVTHPDAYLQDEFAYQTGWSWHRIRTMTRVYPDVDDDATQGSSIEFPEADALEECWVHNEQLDQPNSVTSGLGKPQRRRGTVSSSPSQSFHPARQSWGSSSRSTLQRGQSPLLKSRRGSRPLQISTSFAPAPAPRNHQTPLSTVRRVFSGERSRRTTPAPLSAGVSKRSRRTRSPSHARFTPRWTASPSPVPMGFNERQYARAATPVAYATPHSNAPLQEIRQVSAGSVVMRDVSVGMEDYEDPDDNDDDFDIHIYESDDAQDLSGPIEGDSSQSTENNSIPSEEPNMHAQPRRSQSLVYAQQQQQQVLPEDEPWPGIEDPEGGQDCDEDEENVDPMIDDSEDRRSVVSRDSSRPSEYPTTSRDEQEVEFQIHED